MPISVWMFVFVHDLLSKDSSRWFSHTHYSPVSTETCMIYLCVMFKIDAGKSNLHVFPVLCVCVRVLKWERMKIMIAFSCKSF